MEKKKRNGSTNAGIFSSVMRAHKGSDSKGGTGECRRRRRVAHALYGEVTIADFML